ncbi:MAG TPA: hypothetical protein VKQ72_13270, partial [Aggregatilineales bacterium]|nr:hypothetical protein [Aggregatilineales bacterium]
MSTVTAPAMTTPGDSYARIQQVRLVSWIRIVGVSLCVLWLVLDIWNIPGLYQAWNQVLTSGDFHYASVLTAWRVAPETISAVMTAIFDIQALAYGLVALLVIWKRPFDPVAILVMIAMLGFSIRFPQSDQPVLYFLYNVAYFASLAAIFPMICVFPKGKFRPRWLRWLVWPYLVVALVYTFVPLRELDANLPTIFYMAILLFCCIG